MVVSNVLFDALLFGALLLGIGLDAFFPILHGAGFVIACGLAVNMAAIEFSDWLHDRKLWTQEPLATAIALSTGGFIYFNWANDSDFILLLLSIGLMMGSLMLTIATVAVIGSMFKNRSIKPLSGYLTTVGGSVIIGTLAGLLTLEAPVVTKAGAVLTALVLWKLREKMTPPQEVSQTAIADEPISPFSVDEPANPAATVANAAILAAAVVLGGSVDPSPMTRWQLIPKTGRLLDRFLPLLILGGLLYFSTHQTANVLQGVAPPASANIGNTAHP